MNSYILIGAILCTFAFYSASAIKCYQCNSYENPQCENMRDYPPHNVSHFYQECKDGYQGQSPFCRITITEVKDSQELRETRRVVRSCGYNRSKTACYSADNDFHTETVCQCFEDGCNSPADHIVASRIVALISVICIPLWH